MSNSSNSYIYILCFARHLLRLIFFLQVSDFGLAKLAQDAESHITTRVVGTFGYESVPTFTLS